MIQIYRNNQPFFTIEGACSGSKMSRQLMDHHYIVLKFSTEEPVYFEIGDSVEIAEFGLFVLTSAYFPKYNEATEGYDYELQMDAYYMSWKNKICKYRPQYGANETSFKLTTSVSTHLNVVLSNLKALNYKYHNKDFSVDYTTYNKDAFDTEKRFLVEYSSISIIEVLNTICETLDCEWWVDGSVIYLGYCEMNGQTTFEQGVNMLSMSQSESKSSFITRLYAFGSDKNIPSGYFSGADADVTTDGIATDYLMLPNKDVDEEGYYSKDGYIENVNVVKSDSQAIEGVVKFEDEYPKVSCAVSAIKTYESTVENEDGTKATATFWQITSKESFVTSFETSWIKKGLTLMIRFESGALTGMEFEVNFKIIDKVKYFEIVANDTYGRTLPDSAMCPKIGDKFYLYNWDATKITETPLISEAQEALYVRAKNYYKKSMVDNSNFTCVLDSSKFFNHGTYNFHPLGEQVKLINPLFSDIDSDGKHYRNSRIIGMEINLDIPYDSPTYIIGEKAAYSRLGQLEDKVNSITVNGIQIGNTVGGGGVYVIGMNDTTQETDSNVYSARRTRNSFLSKLHPDVAQKVITFMEGLKLGKDGKMGLTGEGAATLSTVVVDEVRDPKSTEQDRVIVGAQGFDLYMGKDGKSHLYIDYLTTRTKFFAASAEVRKVSYSGGTTLFSNAGSKIMKVAHVLDDAGVAVGYKCYAAADDGTTRTANWWHVGMMALCQTFNVKAGVTENLQNRYYWRLVVGTGQETLEDGKLYDYVILSNKRTFMGSEACVPVTSQKVIGADGKALVFGDVMIQVTTTGEKQSLAAVFEEQEGKTTDDGNNVIANRMFFGYEPAADGGEPDVPQPYDVIVQAGDQIQWNRFGNLIKLTTSTEDGSDNGNAPAIAMYHAMGAPYKTGDTVNPYQWKTLTSLDSPLLVLKNAKNFKFFTDDNPDNIIDPVTVTYDLVPSSEYIIRKPNSQTATPNDITFTLRKRTGNVSETMKDGYLLTADYTTTDGASKSGVAINRLSDIGVSFYLLASVTVRATVKADNTTVALTLPILSDGAKGDTGTSFKVLGYALAHAKTYAELQQITPTDGGLYLVDDTTGMEGGGKKPCVVQWKNGKYIVCDSNDGDSYKIGEILWTNTGTYWLDIGSVKGEGVVISDMSVTYAISDSATVTPTEWQSAIIAATDAKPYLWTRTTVTYKDSEGEHTTVSYAIAYKGKDGDKGDPGANGKDAVEFILKNAPLVFDTDENGVVSASVSKTATIQVMRSGKNITSEVRNLFPSNSNIGCGKPTLTKQEDGIGVTISGASINKDSTLGVSVTSGYVIVYMTIGGTLYSQQIPFMVNVAKFTGAISADNKKLRTDYTELTNRVGTVETDVNGIPIKTQGELTKYTSAIEQTAREISLKVSTAVVERRNLLPGSAFRKQGEGCDFMRSKIVCSMPFDGTNILLAAEARAAGPRWNGAGSTRNIHVTKGKEYTLAFWARAKSVAVRVLGEVRWKKSATDTSYPAGYAGPAGSANLGVESVSSAEGWHLYRRTFTVAADAAYEWIDVCCFKADNTTANEQVYFARPMLIEGSAEDYVCWGLSPDDYNYIGGNLLDNTRTFAKGGNLTRMDASVVTNESYNNGCSVIYANAASKFIEMAQWSVAPFIKKGEDYMFSFVAKGSGTLSVFMWNGSNLSIFAEDSEIATTETSVDGARSFNLTSDWKRYWVHWRSEGTGLPNYALIRCVQGSKAWVTIPKLEVGATPTDWIEGKSGYVEDSGLAAKMLRTGIDIENGKVTATADTFEVQDNRGNTTARITDDGFFTGSMYATNGYFDGLVRNQKRIITKDNFLEYFEKDAYSGMSDAYNPIWDKIGSNFVIQSTPEDADGVAMYLQLALPTAYPITHPYTDGRYERAREVIGNTIIIRCENGNGITLYGTSRTAPNWDSGGVASSPYTLKSGYVVYLTCKVKNTGSSSEESGYETIYWERVVRKALP